MTEDWWGNPEVTKKKELLKILDLVNASSDDIFCDLGCGHGKLCIWASKKVKLAIGETAARAIKGDAEYALTYYKKSREERAEDFEKLLPRLLIFTERQDSIREQIQEQLKTMKKEDLAALLELMNSKKAARG